MVEDVGNADFECAICQRRIDMRWNPRRGSGATLPPVCLYCEGIYSRGHGKPSGGTFRDRRTVTQGLALAEALRCEAAHKKWESLYV